MFIFVKIKLDCSQIWFLSGWGVLGSPKRGKNTFKLRDGHAWEREDLSRGSFLSFRKTSQYYSPLWPQWWGGCHLLGMARGQQKGCGGAKLPPISTLFQHTPTLCTATTLILACFQGYCILKLLPHSPLP